MTQGALMLGAARAWEVALCQTWVEANCPGTARRLLASTGTVARCRRPGWDLLDAGLPPLVSPDGGS